MKPVAMFGSGSSDAEIVLLADTIGSVMFFVNPKYYS